jgi:multidrug efflux system membrane fusion protein
MDARGLAPTDRLLSRTVPVGMVFAGRSSMVLFVALAASTTLAGCGGHAARGPQRVPIAIAVAERRTVPFEIEATGTVEPLRSAAITAQVGGMVTRLSFHEGDLVREGQALFQIDPRPFDAVVARARAAFDRDQAQAEKARLDLARAEELATRQVISADELERKRADAATLAATVRADSAALLTARLDLANATVRAPIGGKTGSLAVHAGDLVRANDGGTPLVTINQIQPIRVRFTVPQTDLVEVRRRRDSLPRVDIAPGDGDSVWIAGTLAFVDNEVDAASGTLLLKAEAPNRDGVLWPGQFVRLRLRLYEQAGATVVPSAAVSSSQRGTYLYVVKPDTTVEERPITVQRTWRDLTVIASGVSAGETVVTDGQVRLAPGAKGVVRSAAGAPGGGKGRGKGGGALGERGAAGASATPAGASATPAAAGPGGR